MSIKPQVVEATNHEESNQPVQGPESSGRRTPRDERRSSSHQAIDSLDDLSDVQVLRRIVSDWMGFRANRGFVEGNGPFTQFEDELRFVSPHKVRSPSTLSNSWSWSGSHRPYSRTEVRTGIASSLRTFSFQEIRTWTCSWRNGSHSQRPVFILLDYSTVPQWHRKNCVYSSDTTAGSFGIYGGESLASEACLVFSGWMIALRSDFTKYETTLEFLGRSVDTESAQSKILEMRNRKNFISNWFAINKISIH